MDETQQNQPEVVQKPAGVAEKQERTWAMLCHLGGFLGFIPPLVIWLIKKDESSLIDDNGKEALNFQISIAIYVMISIVLMFVLIGILLFFAVYIFNIVMIIIAAMKANSGERYRYPLCIRFIK